MKLNKLVILGLVAGAFTIASSAHAVVLLGPTFTPTGANFQITAVQGITDSTPLGATGVSPQVNQDFEFQGSTGVSYDTGGGHLTNFGLGLYSGANNSILSTGLRVDYNNLVTASSIVVTLEDFDIQAGHDTFFNPQKVEPTVLLLGDNNAILGKANPTQIFSALQSTGKDVWNLNFAQLLNNLNIADGPIRGFILAADMSAGEKPNSDPYLMINVGNGIPTVPEADTYMVGLFGIGIAAASVLRSLKRRSSTTI